MSTLSAKSSFQGGPTSRKKIIVRCGCGDVCKVKGEDCGFLKWYNEEDDHIINPTHTKQGQGQGQEHRQLKTLVEIIVDVNHFGLAFGRMFGSILDANGSTILKLASNCCFG
uniref:Uncharacterized protein n=1 Tax=Lactuca sativa TaxID=4236 RepID=A0A9R1VKX3_LACSA|nr:hypothetical protein LSAT_V11C500267710 [Lactuca sativa]